MPSSEKQKAHTAVKKAHGLLGKIQRMIEEDAYCVDVMQQNLAVIGLLKSAHQSLLETHMSHCVKGALEAGSPAKKEEMIEEILKVSKIANR